MPLDHDALRQRLLASFRSEAAERLSTLGDALAQWREGGAEQAEIESLFREVHSIKGAARAAGVTEIERLCHAWESLLGAVRHGELELTAERVELCRLTLKAVQRLHAGQVLDDHEQARLIESLVDSTQGQSVALPKVDAAIPEPAADTSTVRVQAHRLDALLYHSEVLLQHKLEAVAHARDMREHAQAFEPQRTRRMLGSDSLKRLREGLEQLPASARDDLKNLLEHLDWSLSQFDRLHFAAIRLARTGTQLAQGLAQLSEALGEEMQSALLLSGRSPTAHREAETAKAHRG